MRVVPKAGNIKQEDHLLGECFAVLCATKTIPIASLSPCSNNSASTSGATASTRDAQFFHTAFIQSKQECDVLKDKFVNIAVTDTQSLKEAAQKLQNEHAQLRCNVEALQKENQKLKEENAELKKAIEQLQSQVKRLVDQVNELKTEMGNQASRIDDLEAKIQAQSSIACFGEAFNVLKEEIFYVVSGAEVSLEMISLEEFYRQWSRWKRGVCSSDQKRGEIINNGIVNALSICVPPVRMDQFEIACVVVRTRNEDAYPHFKNLQAALKMLESLKDSSSFRDKMHDALENAHLTHNDDFVFDALKVSIQASFHRF
jgi:archaellum component FlaC